MYLILFLQLLNVAAATTPTEQWNRSFGGDGDCITRCVQQTLDYGYVIAGTTIPYGKGTEGYHDAWLIKIDKNGNMQWNKTFSRMYAGLGYFTRQTSDGGYIAAGVKNRNAWLVKLVGDRGGFGYENIRDCGYSQMKIYTYGIFDWIL